MPIADIYAAAVDIFYSTPTRCGQEAGAHLYSGVRHGLLARSQRQAITACRRGNTAICSISNEVCRGARPPKFACNDSAPVAIPSGALDRTGGETEREDGLLCEEDGTVTVRDSLDALLQARCTCGIYRCNSLPSMGTTGLAVNGHSEPLSLLQVLPQDIREPLVQHPCRASLLEVGAELVACLYCSQLSITTTTCSSQREYDVARYMFRSS